jgi:hypothetical protein
MFSTLALRNGVAALLLLLFALPSFAQSFRVQCPPTTTLHPTALPAGAGEPAYKGPSFTGTTSQATGAVNGAIKCQQISGGDGYATMADGTQTYLFSFGPLSGLADIKKGLPGTEFASVFNVQGTAADPNYNGAIGLVPDPESTPPGSLTTGHVDPRQIMDVGVMNGNMPAPTMAIDEDDEFFLTLTNVGMIMRPDLFEQHTVHFHGYPNASAFYDGVPDASVAINCGAIPAHLVACELFGYERGAFTGANERKTGRIEGANGGTVFLDEIADLPMESQVSLLRFLQERRIERLGGVHSTDVDVRIVCATHVDLERATQEGQFREDLYHRLSVLQINEPPLRERGADVELLARHLLDQLRQDSPRRIRGFSDDAIRALRAHDWPGNVRELKNRVWRAVVLFDNAVISAADLGLAHYVDARTVSLDQVRRSAEQQAVERALLRHRGRVADAARNLDISRVTLYRLLESYGFDIAAFLSGMRTTEPSLTPMR